ncbi:MAG: hypothetical protein ACYTFG_03930, partial [Planctomycetota bacterium]
MRSRLLIAATVTLLLAGAAEGAMASEGVRLTDWLFSTQEGSSIEKLKAVTQDDAGEYFRVPYPGKRFLTPPEVPVDYFYETFRLGVDSGLIFPLIARKADYHIGWWIRLYTQIGADLGLSLFRSAVEISLGVGQSQSSHAAQAYELTSNYTFLSVRGIADFLPMATADLFLFGGIGAGFEF